MPRAARLLVLDNVALLGDVDTVKELQAGLAKQAIVCWPLSTSPYIAQSMIAFATYLTDILVAHPADLLDISSGLGDTLEGVAGEDKLILLGLGDLDIDTGLHNDAADDLLADEVAAQTL